MNKIFIFAIAIAFTSLSWINSISNYKSAETFSIVFPYKNTITTNPFDPEKKPAETWSQNWMSSAQENIRKSEYHFTWEEKLNAYCTPNRKNNLRFFYNDIGFSAERRTTQIPIGDIDPMAMPAEIKYRNIPNWKINFNLDKNQLGKGFWEVKENIAAYITQNITVQYINDDEGMRQNFIVYKPLSKTDDLKININIKTKLKTVVENNQVQFRHKNKNVLVYKNLKVWDATGRLLIASFESDKENRFFIKVNAKEAVYPITVDPLSTTPNAFLESNQPNARMGFSVSSAGDVNGDGYSDVVVGVHAYDDGEMDEGAAFVYHGSVTGISNTVATIVQSNQLGAIMGLSVRTAGDVNGDGFSDIIAGSPLFDNGENNEGAAFVYHGSSTGIITTAAAMVESNQINAQLGYSVACAGDVNGDGFSDVIVGAWLYDSPETNEGAAFIYHGSAAGISTTAAAQVESNQAAANFGMSVAGAGDVNGDGYSDIVVGAEDYDDGQTDEGVVFIYHGLPGGIVTAAAVLLQENLTLSQFGFAVSGAGDVNGDGYADVIVGAYLYNGGQPNEGMAFIYHGSGSGINSTAVTLLKCNQAAASFGVSVACAGDINGDGYSDVMVGANQYDDGENNEGAAFVYQGSATGINSASVVILQINQPSADMGRGVGAAGDVNGDGYSDVIVGANQYDNPENSEGAAFVYHGSAAGINIIAGASLEINQSSANIGWSVANAGDVNGDGYSDVIVGAPYYDNGQSDEGAAFVFLGAAAGINTIISALLEINQVNALMGYSVAGAGDVNGDGYSDVIVGAYLYDNGEIDEGGCFVYHGSATGTNTTAATILESNLLSVSLGWSVATAGDVNGDGYGDVIVGAYLYDNGQAYEGAAFVYHGSATGINIAAAATVESNQPDAYLGWSVAGAGDVNGDGYSDVIVGASSFDNGQSNEGAAFIYHGSATGINTTPAAILENNQDDAAMGHTVAGAGDVNCDGYSDVIVGASYFDNGQADEGLVFVYHGTATGINTTVAAVIENDLSDAFLGYSVAGAGDVNGDGYSDVIVGSYGYDNGQADEGAAFVYHGAATGINTVAAATIESNQVNAGMGVSVASAGDINRDGYSDIMVGAIYYNNGEPDEGIAFVYHGNSPGTNKRNNLRLYNTDLTTPLNNNNFIFGNFGAGLYTKSFLGRDSGKIVWETRLNYNAYSGTPLTNSTFFTAQQAGYTDLGLTGVELKSLVTKLLGGRYTKLRARVKYNPAKAITGQVYGPWRYVSSIIDANNLGALPIDLISFNAAWLQKGKTARLDFKTDKESGICCFDIEKSADGFNFYSFGTLPAKNISGIQSYSFIDSNANGKNLFYRIKIKGIAGQVDYSNIQQLQNDKATEILVFPNPTTDVLQLQLNTAFEKMNVQIYNSSGQIIKQLTLAASNQIISIPVQNLATGKYWLYLQSGAEKQVLQFVKQ